MTEAVKDDCSIMVLKASPLEYDTIQGEKSDDGGRRSCAERQRWFDTMAATSV